MMTEIPRVTNTTHERVQLTTTQFDDQGRSTTLGLPDDIRGTHAECQTTRDPFGNASVYRKSAYTYNTAYRHQCLLRRKDRF